MWRGRAGLSDEVLEEGTQAAARAPVSSVPLSLSPWREWLLLTVGAGCESLVSVVPRLAWLIVDLSVEKLPGLQGHLPGTLEQGYSFSGRRRER